MNVELLSHFGNDLMVINSARVSYGKSKDSIDNSDIKLIKYLVEHGHTAPFYHPKLQYRLTIPIYVERQLTKTSIGVDLSKEIDVDINSISGRYVDFSDSYTNIVDWRKQSQSSKQGSEGLLEPDEQIKCRMIEEQIIKQCKEAYQKLLDKGVSKEQARTILPLNLNTTFIWTGSLFALMRLCQLRLKPDAQKETRDVVQEMLNQIKNHPEKPFEHTITQFGF